MNNLKKPTIRAQMSGCAGDIIYQLPTLLSYEKAILYLRPSPLLHPNLAVALIPLIQIQPYIEECKLYNGERFDLALDEFRLLSGAGYVPLTYAGLDRWHRYYNIAEPWLFNITPRKVSKIIVNRTMRYTGSLDYLSIVNKYKDDISFIGSKEEWEKFCIEFGTVAYFETNTFLEVAEIIMGAKIFIGNQSCPYAIAEGMKTPRLLETSIDMPNCQPTGNNGHSSWDDAEDIEIVEKYLDS
uniref:Glycosyltransferase n=1 Tax=viral metagenome TaxID=1070528 RepID=A0A6M3XEV6_9ZZZZ